MDTCRFRFPCNIILQEFRTAHDSVVNMLYFYRELSQYILGILDCESILKIIIINSYRLFNVY